MDKKKWIILIFGMVILSLYVYFKEPHSGPILPCVFNKVTGLYCPGCGMTRAVHSMFHFEFYDALRFNALIFIIPIPLAAYYIVGWRKKSKIANIILVVMLIIGMSYGILRNIPGFDFLAPMVLPLNG